MIANGIVFPSIEGNCCGFLCSGFLTVSPEEIPGWGRAEHVLPGGRSPQLLPPPVRQEADEGVERAGQHQPVRRVVALGRELNEEGEGHALLQAGLIQPPTECRWVRSTSAFCIRVRADPKLFWGFCKYSTNLLT